MPTRFPNLPALRPTVRQIARRPMTAMIVIGTLAVAIGATTALSTVVQSVLLRPLPYPDAEGLLVVQRLGSADHEADVSIPDAEDLRAEVGALGSFAAFIPNWAFDLTGEGDAERLRGVVAEPELFTTLGVEPVAGRFYTDADDVAGGERVAVLGEGTWTRRFGRDPALIGASLQLSGHPVTVIGVAPDATDVLAAGAELWVPPAVETPWAAGERGTNNFEAVARWAPGVAPEAALAELRRVSESLAEAHPSTNRSKILEAVPLREVLYGDVRPALSVLMAAVVAVLLLACANVAGLLLVRAIFREREIAIRRAVGAGRASILAQFLTEGAILAVPGAALGLLLALWLKDLLLLRAPVEIARAEEVAIDARVLGFAVAVTAFVALVTGAIPAWRSWREDRGDLLRPAVGSEGGPSRSRLLDGLVVLEIALSAVLLVGSVLLVRTFLNLRSIDLGFEAGGLVTANVVLPEARYGTAEPQSRFFRDVVAELGRTPGAESAAFVIGVPLDRGFQVGHNFLFEEDPGLAPDSQPSARSRPIVGDFFATMGIPVHEGRAFAEDDDADAPRVAIVNRTLAEAAWPDGSAVGQRISWRFGDEELEWMTIVGVVGDVVGPSPDRGDPPAIYTPYLQRRIEWQRFGQLVVRTRGTLADARTALRDAVSRVDASIPLEEVTTMEARLDEATARERFGAGLFGLFAVVALLLSAQGLYGLLAFSVARRVRELGIRKALGARERDLVGLVLRRGMILSGTGLFVGWVVALVAGRGLDALLFGVAPHDPASYALAGAVLLATATAAAVIPARRAAGADALVSLKDA